MGIVNLLFILALLMPLVLVLIILFKQTYVQKIFFVLAAVCLVSFASHFNVFGIPGSDKLQPFFILLQSLGLIYLFRSVVYSSLIKQSFTVLLISFTSIVATIYLLKEIAPFRNKIEFAQNIILFSVALLTLIELIRKQDVFIFQSSAFWITTGCLIYYSMFIMIQITVALDHSSSKEKVEAEKNILLLIIELVRYIFYFVAITRARTIVKDNMQEVMREYD